MRRIQIAIIYMAGKDWGGVGGLELVTAFWLIWVLYSWLDVLAHVRP